MTEDEDHPRLALRAALWAKSSGVIPPRIMRTLMAVRRGQRRRARRRRELRGDTLSSRPAVHGIDGKLDDLFGGRPGFFVEAGANDGYQQSNTYFLEHFRGWSGVLVEAVPDLAAAARRERPSSQVFCCALVAPEQAGQRIPMFYGDLMSVAGGARGDAASDREWVGHALAGSPESTYSFAATGRTLSSVLDEARAPEIDLLSLDIEGHEAAALRGLEPERHAPRYVLVEILDAAATRDDVESALGDLYIPIRWLSPRDLLFVRSDLRDGRPEVGPGGPGDDAGDCRT